MEILELISHKLDKLGVTTNQTDIEISLEEVDQYIKNYCHIDSIPNELLFVRANLVTDYLRYLDANKPGDGTVDVDNASVGPLTAISSGDVSYSFANNATNKNHISNAHTANLDSLLMNYEAQLNKFRRAVW